MRKSTLIILALLLGLGVCSLLLLRAYKLDLLHTVVMNAVLQKAPQGYSREEIREAFRQARRRAEAEEAQEEYVTELLGISQRLEKIQLLNEKDLREFLEQLKGSFKQRERRPAQGQ